MKVLLIKDIYKLGHAGDIKKVADGYGRNFLLPKGLAILATSGAIKQIDLIRKKADSAREILNTEMSSIADRINGVVLTFSSKAGETGKLYGSITNQMIVDAINSKLQIKIDRHHVDLQPIRTLGEHKAIIRLTVDLTPEVKVIIYREGETVTVVDPQTSIPIDEESKNITETPISAAVHQESLTEE